MELLELDRNLMGYKVEETRPVTGETKINIVYIREPGAFEVKMTTKRTMNWRHTRMDVEIILESTDRLTGDEDPDGPNLHLAAGSVEEEPLTGFRADQGQIARNRVQGKGSDA